METAVAVRKSWTVKAGLVWDRSGSVEKLHFESQFDMLIIFHGAILQISLENNLCRGILFKVCAMPHPTVSHCIVLKFS